MVLREPDLSREGTEQRLRSPGPYSNQAKMITGTHAKAGEISGGNAPIGADHDVERVLAHPLGVYGTVSGDPDPAMATKRRDRSVTPTNASQDHPVTN